MHKRGVSGKLPNGALAALWVPFGTLLAFAAAAGPLADDMVSEQAYLGEVPVVLSASRMSQPVSEVPDPVTVIDREMIRASGFREIADLFRLVPGFYVGYFNGHDPVVAHGPANRYFGRVQVLVDGRSVYSPLWGTVDWTGLPLALEDIERIEVVRGPNAANYGANAFLGVINIITRHAQEDRGTTVSAAAGQPGMTDTLLRHGGRLGELSYRVTLGTRSDDGFDGKHDGKRVTLFTARGDYQLNLTDTLQAQVGYNGSKRGVGFFGDPFDIARDENVDSHFEQLRWQRSLSADNEVSLNLYHTYHGLADSYITLPYTDPTGIQVLPTPISYDTTGERYEAELQNNLSPAYGLRLVWGAATRIDRIRAPLYLGAPDTRESRLQRLFGSAEWHVTRDWVFNAGAMWEHNDVTGSDISPGAALIYHLSPRQTVRVGISSALRTPTLLEDEADFSFTAQVRLPPSYNTITTVTVPRFLSAGGLAPERITSKEIGYLGEFPRLGLSLDVRAHRDELRDLIVPTGDVAPYRFVNAYSATIDGLETQVIWRAGSRWRVWFSHSYSHVASTDPSGDLERSTPTQIYSLLAWHSFGQGYEGSLGFYGVREMEPQGDGDPLPAYHRLDVRLAKKMKWLGRRAEVALVVQNLLGPYQEFRNDNLFQRRAFVSLNLDL